MVMQIMRYKVAAIGLSDVGRVRQNNEDSWAAVPEMRCYVLADGMGGHRAGEVAAKETVNIFCELLKELYLEHSEPFTLHELRRNVAWIIEEVNEIIYKQGRSDRHLKGMGTTFCCLHFYENGLIYAHVGDSRIYRLRRGSLSQLTKDHSLLRQLIDMGQMSEQKASDFLYKNIITKAIGTEPHVDPSVHGVHFDIEDVYLMCSDGLSDLLNMQEIEDVLNATSSIQEAARRLVDCANERGGHDNITVVIAKVLQDDEQQDLSR